jgi:trans-aconitate 2-methyltransferase
VKADRWDPAQYERFAAERRQPYDDLAGLLEPVAGGRVIDLGCGTGELTVDLHRSLGAGRTVGVDSSPAMLAAAGDHAIPGVTFRLGDLRRVEEGGWDLVFANASLHWVPDHPALLGRLRQLVAAGGQMAFQVPANFDHASHQLADEVAAEAPFAARLGPDWGPGPAAAVLDPAHYATLLDAMGAVRQHVRLQVYGHHLAGTADVVEWVKGTALTRYRDALGHPLYDEFLARYQGRLIGRLGDQRPYFYTYKRILAWGRFA